MNSLCEVGHTAINKLHAPGSWPRRGCACKMSMQCTMGSDNHPCWCKLLRFA